MKPERASKSKEVASIPWWQYWRIRQDLRTAIKDMSHVLAGVIHTKYWSVSFCNATDIFSHALVVFSMDNFADFSMLMSTIHQYSGHFWGRKIDEEAIHPLGC